MSLLFQKPKSVDTLPDEERAHGTISMKTYYQYFKAGGGYIFTIVVLALTIIAEVVQYRHTYICALNFCKF